MKETRWLLPFTFGVNMRALDHVFRLAEHCEATLVAASLIVLPDTHELLSAHLQQSKAFLEAVQWKATQYRVLVEPHEIWTSGVQARMKRLVLDLQCDSIVLVTEGQDAVLLSAHEMEDVLMGCLQASLVLVRLQALNKGTIMAYLCTSFFSWIHKLWERHCVAETPPVVPIQPGSERENVSG